MYLTRKTIDTRQHLAPQLNQPIRQEKSRDEKV
jgi:hypothetical protein